MKSFSLSPSLSKGFTLIELIITMSAFLVLVTLATLNLGQLQRRTSVDSVIDKLVSDFKSQQMKAVNGDTEALAGPVYTGIYVQATQYTLFHGNSYNAASSTNFVVSLPANIQVNNAATPYTILFSPITGDISGYSSVSNTIKILDSTTTQLKTLQFNQYGAIISVT